MAANARRTKGAGGAFKDKNGTWHFRREIDPDPATGKRRYIEATGKVKSEARARFDEKVSEYERTGMIRSTTSPYVRDYANRWMEDHRKDVKPNTWGNENSWMRAMCEHIGGIRLAALRADDIQRMIRGLQRGRSQSTINCYLSVLSAMLDDAEYEGLIDITPMRHVKRRKNRKRTRAVLSSDDPKRLLAAVYEYQSATDTVEERDMWRLMFELAFSTGMRPGERYALMPFQLERRHGVPGINVCQQIQRYTGGEQAVIPAWLTATHLYGCRWLTTPKSERGNRFIPISEDLWRRLWEHVACWGIGDRQLMFANAYGRPLMGETERKRWRRCLEAAGLPSVDVYSARHWLSTVIGESGASDDERMLIMGHADIETTARYTHWSPQALARTMSAVPDLGA
ncbi:tyrosine-type recombinase/integrase [Bifidobacterium biavatii]|uniref:Integrase n=1 Tax=Bifidobacterium biavatii DSM 23969 TaxID=1437608 RepID=A0A086ZYY7_9BIFI|nr:site-specific integrase [Bifidobacterium biavatii]KFI51737.1 integrase [Bifidobacterium biavatii DSM 23969]